MKNSRTKNAKKNIISAFLLQVTKIILVLGTRIIFVKELGAAYLGINGLFSNILSILSLADLGMGTAMMYALYKPLAKDDKNKISAYISFFNKIYNYIALAVFLIGIIMMPFLKYIINLPSNIDNIYLYYFLLLMNSVISYLFVYKTTLLSADQKNYIITRYDFIMQIILFILQILVLIFTKSFALYLLANIITTIIGNILKVKKTEKIYPYIKTNNRNLTKNEKKDIYSNIKSLFAYKLGDVIQSNTDNILISIFVGTITVGYYSNYNTVSTYLVTFLTIVFTSLKAGLGNYVVEKSKEEQIKLFDKLETVNFWLVSFCAISFTALISDFIKICFGNEYILAPAYVFGIMLIFYTTNIRQNLWMYRETTGMFNRTKYITLITSLLNLIFAVIGGRYFGLLGIIYASVLAKMVYAWWKEPIIIFKEYFKKSSKEYFVNYIKRLILMIIMTLSLLLLLNHISISNVYLLFVLKLCITAMYILIIYYLIYRKSDAFHYLKEKCLKR